MKTILLSFVWSLSIILSANAQTSFELPDNIELKVKEDYAKYEPSIIAAAKWIEETDLDKEVAKRKRVNAFIVQWVTGSPTVSVSISERLGKIYGNNAELLVIYIASYSRHYIENKTSASAFSATKAGLTSIMNVYKKKINISKSKEMEKIIKLNEENKLDAYIQEHFK